MRLPPLPRRALALRSNRRGATAVEYGLIVALIVLAIFGSVKGLASVTVGMWGNISTKVQSTGPS